MGRPEGHFTRRSFLEAGSAAAVLAAAAPVRGAAPALSPALDRVRGYVIDKVETGIVPARVVRVPRGGRPIWAEAFGFADLEARRPATLESIYKIASITKPFTVSGL